MNARSVIEAEAKDFVKKHRRKRYVFIMGETAGFHTNGPELSFDILTFSKQQAVDAANELLERIRDEHTGVVVCRDPELREYNFRVWIPDRSATEHDISRVEP